MVDKFDVHSIVRGSAFVSYVDFLPFFSVVLTKFFLALVDSLCRSASFSSYIQRLFDWVWTEEPMGPGRDALPPSLVFSVWFAVVIEFETVIIIT